MREPSPALHLGRCYEAGNGVPQSDAEAARWYKLAADQGYAEAQYRLGLCYYHGKGVEANCSEAILWLKCAAAQGDSAAADFLRKLGVEP
ncbi:MAG: sel1 repeat family protein [Akkermansiaceae bacterium]|nr:sel1 repeat family protein [Akkermansiaceae bacterium]